MDAIFPKHSVSKKPPSFQKNLKTAYLTALGLILLTALSSWPFIINPSLPADNDAELHIYRIAEMGYSLDEGILYPRWAPDFYHGYGYPIFNYYAPLTYHLGYWVSLGHPQFAAKAAKTLFVGAHMLGIFGAYQLGKSFGKQSGGLLGATAFAFSPYIQFINPHVRGNLAEVLALGCLPWVLWSWQNLWKGAGFKFSALAVVSTAATLLSHNLTGLTMLGLVSGLSVWHLLIHGRRKSLRNALFAGVVFVLLTAFFWLPFLLERQYIQLEDVTGEGHYDYRQHFIPLPELLTLLPPQDYRASAPVAPMTIGPPILILAIVGLVASYLANAKMQQSLKQNLYVFVRSDMVFFAISTLFCIWLTQSSSAWIWRIIPGLVYFQFPWRFLGPIAILLVPLVAGIGNLVPLTRTRGWILGISISGLILLGLPGLYPRSWQSKWEPIDRLAIVNAELEDRWRGTTSTNDFVPRSVQMIPGPQESVLASYRNPPIDRVNRHTLPEGTTVQVVSDAPKINRFAVKADESFTLRLYLFDFPGWAAYIDGEEVPIKLANPEGFITVEVPAGDHTVDIRFELTPPRWIGWLLTSFGGFLGFIGMPMFFRGVNDRDETTDSENDQEHTISTLVITVGLFLIANVFVFHPLGWFRYTSDAGTARPAETTQYATFESDPGTEEINLLGYDLSHETIKSGRTLNVTLYWMAARPITRTYQSFVHIVDSSGHLWAQSDHLNPAGFPTDRWPLNRYIRDTHQLTLPPGTPEGSYTIHTGLYRLEEDQRLSVIDTAKGKRSDATTLSRRLAVKQ
jgi:hypothetical protein